MDANKFAKSGKHLPRFLRDFHDAKDVFKCVGGMYPVGEPNGAFAPWALIPERRATGRGKGNQT